MDNDIVKILQYVNTGEVHSGGIETVLNSGAIGSCVVITAFDSGKNIGVMAHVMLPGICPAKNQLYATRYAPNAIEEMLTQLKRLEVEIENIEICIVGGANVLKREKDTIGNDNLESVNNLLLEKHLEIKASSIGGFDRRTVIFDVMKGCIYYTVGNSKQKILWQTESKK